MSFLNLERHSRFSAQARDFINSQVGKGGLPPLFLFTLAIK
jgi:hypothetical protein